MSRDPQWYHPDAAGHLSEFRPLRAPDDSLVPAPDTLVIVAHPDDEVIGAGAHLSRLGNMMVIHVTDGAPRDMDDALKSGYSTRADYADARRKELEKVLDLVGIQPSRARCLGIVDGEAALHLVEITRRLAAMLVVLRPAIVLTHAYEGGHPDHDATAFAVHAATRLLRSGGIEPPVIIEIASYPAANGSGMVCSDFLPVDGRAHVVRELNEDQRAWKQKLLSCYTSQQNVLRAIPVNDEKFRVALEYDFTAPPHAGPLYYESQPWGMTAARWQNLATQALSELNLPVPPAKTDGRTGEEPSPLSDPRRVGTPFLP